VPGAAFDVAEAEKIVVSALVALRAAKASTDFKELNEERNVDSAPMSVPSAEIWVVTRDASLEI
jgi:hypothetical protein